MIDHDNFDALHDDDSLDAESFDDDDAPPPPPSDDDGDGDEGDAPTSSGASKSKSKKKKKKKKKKAGGAKPESGASPSKDKDEAEDKKGAMAAAKVPSSDANDDDESADADKADDKPDDRNNTDAKPAETDVKPSDEPSEAEADDKQDKSKPTAVEKEEKAEATPDKEDKADAKPEEEEKTDAKPVKEEKADATADKADVKPGEDKKAGEKKDEKKLKPTQAADADDKLKADDKPDTLDKPDKSETSDKAAAAKDATDDKDPKDDKAAAETKPEPPPKPAAPPPPPKPAEVTLRIKRQDGPGKGATWETYRFPYKAGAALNIISCLQEIQRNPTTADGKKTTPVNFDSGCLEEVCGSCTMNINGKVRQACTALVEAGQTYTLEPIGKFPLVRDLIVDRQRMFHALKKVNAWISIDGTHQTPTPLTLSDADQQAAYPLSTCMTCGACLEACPNYKQVDPKIARKEGESFDDFHARRDAEQQEAFDTEFVGAFAISQVRLMNMHPTGKFEAHKRTDALMGDGGLSDCGNAQNCVKVCPKEIPLVDSIGVMQRQATARAFKKLFGG